MIIGNGVDIIEVKRIRQATERWGDEFLGRLFTQRELNNARGRAAMFEHLAGRFAVKEAISKALGDKDLGWKEVEVINDSKGRPSCIMHNERYKKLDIHISISHVKNYAVASAVVTKTP